MKPPKLAERLLKASLPAGDLARTILGDLREEFSEIASTLGRARAEFWYWRQAIAIGVRYVPVRGKRRRGDGFLRSIYQDLRFSFRSMRRSPGVTLTAVATLAVGIGAATALFTVLQRVVLQPLPYPEATEIVSVSEDNPEIDMPIGFTSLPNYLDWKRDSRVFETLGLFRGRSMSITGEGNAEYVYGAYVTPEFFTTFGVEPLLGRAFTDDESLPGDDRVAVLAYGSWQRLYGGLPSIIGQTIVVDAQPRTVVGVMPRGFNAPAGWISANLAMDVWIPFPIPPDISPDARNNRSFSVVGRLRDGVGADAARAEMETIHARLRADYPEANEAWNVQLIPWHEMVVGRVRRPLYLLFGAVSLLLLIACANVANLQLNRLLSRKGELSLRAALGAGRLQLVRHIMMESTAMAMLGAVAGISLSFAAVELLVAIHPGDLPRLREIAMDHSVFGAVLVFAPLTVLISGLGPAVVVLRRAHRLDTRGSESHRLQRGVVVLQLALSMVLLVGSGLLARSFFNLSAVAPGLDPRGVLSATVALSWDRVDEMQERASYVHDVLDRLETLPGIDRVAMINSLPFSGSNQYQQITIEGASVSDPSKRPACALRGISPGYFETMGITLVEGREFDEFDVERADAVIVSRTAAELYWPDQDPLGKRVAIGNSHRWLTIVGVVADVKHWGLDADVIPELYQPYTTESLTSKSFVMRTAGDPESLTPNVRDAILSVDPDQPVRDIRTMRAYLATSLAPARFQTVMMVVASTLALALAAVGLFSVMAVSVTERRQEIGIRMALGAEHRGVVQLFLRRALTLSLLGIGGGLVIALALAHLLDSLLFEVSPLDTATYALAFVGLIIVSLAASYIPAFRASGLDPSRTLRSE